jgi:CheY-like chemotaxis protein
MDPGQIHALVVDDSNSARLVMGRMLEKLGIDVNTVESAAAAIEFLTRKTPDVILMDHMMPDMDGFEAVKVIKSNPDTATIPIMMYTSKGGDLYLGQARALGAVGILPKTVAPGELLDSLKRIGLIAEEKAEITANETTLTEKAADTIEADTSVSEVHENPHEKPVEQDFKVSATEAQTDSNRSDAADQYDPEEIEHRIRRLLLEQRVELYNDLLLSVDSFSDHLGTRIKNELDNKTELSPESPSIDKRSQEKSYKFATVALLLASSVIWNISFLLQNDPTETADPVISNIPQSAALTEPLAADNRVDDDITIRHTSALHNAISWAVNQSMYYPFNELALDNQRIDMVMELLDRLSAAGFEGKVELETHVGKFCLQTSSDGRYKIPAADVSMDECDFVGNPVQPSGLASAQQSLRFANYLNNVSQLYDNRISLDVQTSSRDKPLQTYPDRSANTKASAWNKIAARNNHVIVRLVP